MSDKKFLAKDGWWEISKAHGSVDSQKVNEHILEGEDGEILDELDSGNVRIEDENGDAWQGRVQFGSIEEWDDMIGNYFRLWMKAPAGSEVYILNLNSDNNWNFERVRYGKKAVRLVETGEISSHSNQVIYSDKK